MAPSRSRKPYSARASFLRAPLVLRTWLTGCVPRRGSASLARLDSAAPPITNVQSVQDLAAAQGVPAFELYELSDSELEALLAETVEAGIKISVLAKKRLTAEIGEARERARLTETRSARLSVTSTAPARVDSEAEERAAREKARAAVAKVQEEDARREELFRQKSRSFHQPEPEPEPEPEAVRAAASFLLDVLVCCLGFRIWRLAWF